MSAAATISETLNSNLRHTELPLIAVAFRVPAILRRSYVV
jgi:hypothetical protein